jgi:iron complex outermembrane receptor protein
MNEVRVVLIIGCLAAATFLAAQQLDAQEPERVAEAEQITVTGETTRSLTSQSPDDSAKHKSEVPGAFTVKTADEMKNGRASNLQDLLQRAPGVVLQSENEAEVSKVSIRGSGITSEDEPIGVTFLLDGLNYNQADGEAILEDFDVTTLSHAEIYRGADAFKYGALTLGGAINLVPLTGYNAAPFQTRVEAGSYGYFRGEASSGGLKGAVDAFASVSARVRDGFREHSQENTELGFADVGYKFSDNVENRFYLSLDRADRDLPGGLTKSQLERDPQQANPLAIEQDWSKDWTYIRLADELTAKIDNFQVDAGVFWFHRDLEKSGFFSPDFRQGIETFYSDNFGANVNFVSREPLFGRRNLFTIGSSPQVEDENSQNFENHEGRLGATTARSDATSINLPFYFEDQFYVTDRLSLVAAVQAIFAERDFRDEFLSDAQGDQSRDQEFFGFNPKFGAIYEFDPRWQVFANVSRSWQPPSFDNLVEFTEGPNSSVVYTPLDPQHAWTVELGTRGQRPRVEWELSIYRSWLRDELLELNDQFGNDIGAVNVHRSIHQGVEAGLELQLLDHLFFYKTENRPGDQLSFAQSYTFNDFHFDHDPVYGDNRIAGIPIHVYEAELSYRTPTDFYVAPNIQCNLSRYPVDHANTLFADPYALLGVRIGFAQPTGWSIFLDCKNLTDQRYASSIDVIADARTQPKPQIFHPGDGRAFYGGVSWAW